MIEPNVLESVFDVAALMARFRGNRDFVVKLLTLFGREAIVQLDNILKAQAKTALPELRAAAHAMKGVALNVSAVEVGNVAARLEKQALQAELGSLAPTVAELRRLIDMAVAAVPRTIDQITAAKAAA